MSFTAGSLRGAGGAVDHRLSRQHLINEYRRGRLSIDQVCDAHPELMRAARNFGEESRVKCPICADDRLVLVTYAFGPHLPSHGRCVTTRSEMAQIQRRANAGSGTAEYTAYVVEACRLCRWHHLVRMVPITPQRAASA
ncbi:MAG: DUF5318 domain-containing protein [Ilumatobacteraceae bacterium]|nr:DUF5318 domain-containing protein [Ilumatobacteraceae bacterium]